MGTNVHAVLVSKVFTVKKLILVNRIHVKMADIVMRQEKGINALA